MQERIDQFYTIERDEKLIIIRHCGEIKLMLTQELATKIADQISAWAIDEHELNIKDEDGNPVSDNVIMGSLN